MPILTKVLSANGANGKHKFVLTVTEDSTTNTTSLLSFTFQLIPIKNAYDWYGWGENIKYDIVIGSNTYSGSIPSYDGYATVTLKSGSNIEIVHETDGTKTIPISFSVVDNAGQYYTPGNASASGTMTLTPLHKPPVINDFTIKEQNQTLIDYGINDTTIVPYLSKKLFTIDATLYDDTPVKWYMVVDSLSSKGKASETSEVTIDFSQFTEFQYKYDSDISKYYGIFNISVYDQKEANTTKTWSDNTVIPYTIPNLIKTESSVKRNGQVTGKAKLNLTGTFYNGKIGTKDNSIKAYFKYWVKNSTEPTEYFEIPMDSYIIDNDSIKINGWNIAKDGVEVEDLNKSNVYTFKIKLVDTFNNTSEIELTLTRGIYLRAIFKDRIDFEKITIQKQPLVDFVVEQGDNYTKWASGKMEQWQLVSMNPSSITEASGSVYRGDVAFPDWEVPFIAPPERYVYSVGELYTNRPIWIGGPSYINQEYKIPTATSPGIVQVFMTWSGNCYGYLHIYAVGRWKEKEVEEVNINEYNQD